MNAVDTHNETEAAPLAFSVAQQGRAFDPAQHQKVEHPKHQRGARTASYVFPPTKSGGKK